MRTVLFLKATSNQLSLKGWTFLKYVLNQRTWPQFLSAWPLLLKSRRPGRLMWYPSLTETLNRTGKALLESASAQKLRINWEISRPTILEKTGFIFDFYWFHISTILRMSGKHWNSLHWENWTSWDLCNHGALWLLKGGEWDSLDLFLQIQLRNRTVS